MKPSPPHNALKFLRWFCREDYIEEIEGDLVEVFEKQYEHSQSKARWKFIWSAIRYFRPEFIRSFKRKQTLNHTAMFRHNFLLTYRTFKRYKMSFFINLIGLSAGLACALLIYLWVHDELSVDKFHEKDTQLFQVMERNHRSDGIVVFENTPGPLAAALAEEMPEIEYAVTASWTENPTLSVKDKNIRATGQFVSKNFFHVFSYSLIQGDENQVLADKNSIVISESLALKLFNTTENVMGKMIEFQHEKPYQVSGVFRDIPTNSSEQFEFVLSFEAYKEKNAWASEWDTQGPRTFVILQNGTDRNQFNQKIADFMKSKNDDPNLSLFVRPYSEKYLYSKYENGVQAGGRIEYVRLFSIIAIFVLLIACINFMNLSTAKAFRRLKEVGIKKAIGAGRKSLVFQYLGESVLMTFLSLTIALFLIVILLPQFNEITGKQLSLHLNTTILSYVLGITLFTGLMAGSYPALYLSGFNPVAILKGGGGRRSSAPGKLNTSVGEIWTRKGLVIVQFTLSIILIVSVLVVYKQIEYVQTKNLGYNKDNIIYFPRVGEHLETFLSEVNTLPGIISASSIGHSLLGYYSSTGGVQWEGKNPEDKIAFEIVQVNYDMLELLDITLKEGRSFSRDFSSDSSAIIFNEAAIEVMGLTDPVGKVVKQWNRDRQIIGVVKNFHFTSLHENVVPLYIVLAPDNTWNVMVRIEAGREKEALTNLQQLHQHYYPDFPFEYQFLDQQYQALYTAEQRVSTLSKYFAGLAILISCLGLFGLAAFTAERRLKEIGIRKILGATDFGIVQLLSADFTRTVFIAIVIALPISYFLARNWLESFAYRIDLQWWFFVGAGLVALLIAWFTVGLQTVKAARINPTQCLKDE